MPYGLCDRDHGTNGGDAIIDISTPHRSRVENCRCETLELLSIEMPIKAEHAGGCAGRLMEDVDVARFVEPWIVRLADDTSVFAVDLEAFVPVHADGNSQIEVAKCAVVKRNVDEPAIRAEAFGKPRLHLQDFSTKVARSVEQVTAVSQHVVLQQVGLWITGGPLCSATSDNERLRRVRLVRG